MKQNRPKLSLRHDATDALPGNDVLDVLKQAIAHQLCVRATYNRVAFILAPHILYARHGEPHLDAVAIERDGAKPQEMKLGMFKLSGLRGVAATSEPALPFPGFDPGDPRYSEHVIAAISQ